MTTDERAARGADRRSDEVHVTPAGAISQTLSALGEIPLVDQRDRTLPF